MMKMIDRLRQVWSLWRESASRFFRVCFSALKKSGRSILWNILSAYLNLFPEKQPYDSTMGHIYLRDFPTFVMPIRKEDVPDFKIVLKPADKEFEKLLIKALETNGMERRDLTEAVSDFVEDVIPRLLIWRSSGYLVSLSTALNSNQVQCKNLEFKLLPGSLFNWLFYYVHCIHRSFSQRAYMRGGIKPHPTFFRRKDVFKFMFPKNLLSKKEHKKMVNALIKGSRLQPKFVEREMNKYFQTFDFMKYHRANLVELLRGIGKLGASINFPTDKYSSEFYRFHLFLRLYYTLAVLRESVMDQLNNLLQQLGLDYSLSIEGLPTSAQVHEAIEKLDKGEIDFRQAVDLSKTS